MGKGKIKNKKNMKVSNKKIVVLTLILFTVSFAFSQNEKHPIDIKNIQCHENSIPTTHAAMQCEDEALKAWQTEMNFYLEKLKEKSELINVALLLDAQEKWHAFHKADVALYASYLQQLYQGGTLGRVAIITYEKKLIRKRTLHLQGFYEDLE